MPVVAENARPGTPGWELLRPARNHEIEGFASGTSVAPGETLSLYVNAASPRLDVAIYRMGWYGGVGARLVLERRGVPGGPRPIPAPRPGDGLVECDWPVTCRIAVPGDWVSGVYLARLTGLTDGFQSYIPFVVRESGRLRNPRTGAHRAPLLFQCSVMTWQAYNNWGGKSLYDFNSDSGARAVRVSFDRPYGSGGLAAAGAGAGEFLTVAHGPHAGAWEYPCVRWLERNGYDVAYATNLDVDARREPLRDRRAILIVGHDEYWSGAMRRRLEEARGSGIHLGFLSSNTGYWQVRLEPDRRGSPGRVVFCAKEAERDPVYNTARDTALTVRFRNLKPRRPEVSLVGMMLSGGDVEGDFVPLPEARGHWVYAGTGFASGEVASAPNLLGYEVDRTFADDSLYARWSPPGLTVLARARLQPIRGGPVPAETSIYTSASGAIVFAAGTNQWSWGLDDWGATELRPAAGSPDVERVTRNVLAAFLRAPGRPPSPRSPPSAGSGRGRTPLRP